MKGSKKSKKIKKDEEKGGEVNGEVEEVTQHQGRQSKDNDTN